MFAALLCIIGIFGIYYGYLMQGSRRKVLVWPQTPGKISQRGLVKTKQPKGGYSYSPQVQYTYRAGGKPLTGQNIYRMGSGGSSSQKNQQAFLDKIPDDVMVYYDPENPTDSCLFPEKQGFVVLAYSVGVSLLLVGIGLLAKRFLYS